MLGNAWSRIGHADGEVAVDRLGNHAHLAGVRKLDGVAYEIEEHLGKALLIAETNGQGLGHLGRERELLILGERLGGRAYRLDYALDGVFGHVQGELTGLDLGNVEHGIDEAQQVPAVGADAGERVQGFLAEGLVEAFLHELGITENRRQWGSSWLMLATNCDLCLLAISNS